MSLLQNISETSAQADKRVISQVLREWVSDAYARGDKEDFAQAVNTLYAFFDGQSQAPKLDFGHYAAWQSA